MEKPLQDILKLSVAEKVKAVETIWNSIEENSMPASKNEITIAKERYEEYLKNPNDVIEWEKARQSLMKKYGF